MKDKFLIIGSNSFSGSSFIKYLLKKKKEVIAVSRSSEYHDVFLPYKTLENSNNIQFNQFDLNTNLNGIIELIKHKKPSFIINFAALGMVAESWSKPENWYQTNVVGQVKLHDQLRKMNFIKKYIHISTPEVYGSTSGTIKENYNFSPSTPYAVSRASCDMHLLSFFKAYNFPVIFTRAANVYGAGQQLYRIIPRSILYAKLQKKLNLHGGGASIRSFIHIDDVSHGIMKILKHGLIGETYHISTDEFISIKDLVKKICKKLNVEFSELVEESYDRLGKDQAYQLHSEKLKKLKWNTQISLDQGLDSTIDWIVKNFDVLKKMPQEYIHKF